MNRKMSDYFSVGLSIVLFAAIGILVGVLLENIVLWLIIGAAVGVVFGAVIHQYVKKKKSEE
ncbi:MAG: hypothetical protein GX264_02445 [Clostridiales bacterium]|jgi:uncharacterized membrane protein YfcA|nr:hypothetical protein [Clostridiales bacterium]